MMFDPFEFAQSASFKHNVDEPDLVRTIYVDAGCGDVAEIVETFIVDLSHVDESRGVVLQCNVGHSHSSNTSSSNVNGVETKTIELKAFSNGARPGHSGRGANKQCVVQVNLVFMAAGAGGSCCSSSYSPAQAEWIRSLGVGAVVLNTGDALYDQCLFSEVVRSVRPGGSVFIEAGSQVEVSASMNIYLTMSRVKLQWVSWIFDDQSFFATSMSSDWLNSLDLYPVDKMTAELDVERVSVANGRADERYELRSRSVCGGGERIKVYTE